MSKSLVIVESPAKAKTIGKYLGKGFEVLASVGHIMDLPKNDIGVELEKRTFEPTLIVSPGKEKVVAQLKKAAAKADEIFLAPDPDREGEAIAYHLATATRDQRQGETENPPRDVQRDHQEGRAGRIPACARLDQNLVDAQQTRRVLDRLVGYQISPLLWDKVRRGFRPAACRPWPCASSSSASARSARSNRSSTGRSMPSSIRNGSADESFKARFVGIDGEPARVANGKDKDGKDQFIANALPDQKSMDEVVAALENANWSVVSVQSREQLRRPLCALHHQPVAARCRRQAGLQRAAHHGRGAASV